MIHSTSFFGCHYALPDFFLLFVLVRSNARDSWEVTCFPLSNVNIKCKSKVIVHTCTSQSHPMPFPYGDKRLDSVQCLLSILSYTRNLRSLTTSVSKYEYERRSRGRTRVVCNTRYLTHPSTVHPISIIFVTTLNVEYTQQGMPTLPSIGCREFGISRIQGFSAPVNFISLCCYHHLL